MDDLEQLKEMRDSFREIADIIDGILKLQDSADKGIDVEKDVESLVGRFTIKLMKLRDSME